MCRRIWSPPFPGYHISYPSRRQSLPAFKVIVDALRHGSGQPCAIL